MKVTRKQVYVQNDCFEASEGACTISIRRFKHHVRVKCYQGGGDVIMADISLDKLARLLSEADKHDIRDL